MTKRSVGFDSRAIHAGAQPNPGTGARVTPIHQTTSYVFDNADEAADRYALEARGDIYSRISNPTVRALEDRLADLAGGTAAVATASGMAALDAATLVLAGAGDSVVSAGEIYGGTRSYLTHTAGRRSIEARFVDALDLDAYAGAIDETTKFVHLETIGNPSLVTPDIEGVAEIAHDAGIPLVVDNTFATPALCRPLEHGADAVWHSTTKWLHGGGTTVGGILIDGGAFDWDPDTHPEIAAPNPAFHGQTFSEVFEDAPLAGAARHRSVRSIGSCQSPFDAWQTLQGIETLPIRMARHSENAAVVAEFLADHPDVAWVGYPGIEFHETYRTPARYLDGGYGGMIAFGLDGGFEAGKRLCEAVEVCSFLANVGDAKTLVIHPASTTHAQLTADEQRESGVTPDLVRLSVGLEDPADVVADLDRAIERATAVASA